MSRAPGAVRMRRREFLRAGLAGLSGLTLPGSSRCGRGRGPARRASGPRCSSSGSRAGRATWRPTTPSPTPRPRSAARSARSPRRPRASASASSCRSTPGWPTSSRSSARSRTRGSATSRAISRCSRGTPSRCSSSSPSTPTCSASRTRQRADPGRRVPAYVGVNPIPYLGSAYLGPAYEPFAVHGDPNAPDFSVPGIGLEDAAEVGRLGGRMGLAKRFDGLRRAVDDRMQSEAFDAFQQQAFTLLTGPEAQEGVRPEPGRPPAPRPLRPEHLGPALPAGPAAGRGGRGPRHDEPRRPALRPGRQLGRPRGQPPRLRRHEVALPLLRPGGRAP